MKNTNHKASRSRMDKLDREEEEENRIKPILQEIIEAMNKGSLNQEEQMHAVSSILIMIMKFNKTRPINAKNICQGILNTYLKSEDYI